MLANIRRSPPSCCRAKATNVIGRTEEEREAKQRELAHKVEEVKHGAFLLYPWLARFFPGTSLSNSDRILMFSRAVTGGCAMLEGPRSSTPHQLALPAPALGDLSAALPAPALGDPLALSAPLSEPQGVSGSQSSRPRKDSRKSTKRRRSQTPSPSSSSRSSSPSIASNTTRRTIIAGESDLPEPAPTNGTE